MSHLEQVLSLAFCSFCKSLSEQEFEALCENILSQLPRGGWKCDGTQYQKGERLVCVREAKEAPILLLDFNGAGVRGQVQMKNAPANHAERIRKHNAYLSEFVRTFLPGEEEGLMVDGHPLGADISDGTIAALRALCKKAATSLNGSVTYDIECFNNLLSVAAQNEDAYELYMNFTHLLAAGLADEGVKMWRDEVVEKMRRKLEVIA